MRRKMSRALSVSTGLSSTTERVVAAHEADRAARDPAAAHALLAGADGGQVRAGAAAELEEHGLGLREVHDRAHVVLDAVDEAGRALRLRLDPDVEPDRRVER